MAQPVGGSTAGRPLNAGFGILKSADRVTPYSVVINDTVAVSNILVEGDAGYEDIEFTGDGAPAGEYYEQGDVVLNIRSREIYYVESVTSVATTDVYTMVRHVDGSGSDTVLKGDAICYQTQALRIDEVLGYTKADKVFTCDIVQDIALDDIAPADSLFRRSRRLNVRERIKAKATGVSDVTFKRDLTLITTFDEAVGYPVDISDDEILFKLALNIKDPQTAAGYLDFFEIETLDAISKTKELTTVNAMTNKSGVGKVVIDDLVFGCSATIPYTDILMQNYLSPDTVKISSNEDAVGSAFVVEKGKDLKGSQIVISGQEEKNVERTWYFNAVASGFGEVSYTNAQRSQQITWTLLVDDIWGVYGCEWNPNNCN